ncbi:uncharacterized protein N7479_004441 [Penicillium vulpinum]|uniref:Uncharacterized protein n=1 Tax=Penicillium vulpinum TaxID=29845 RepID=A0A1V6SCN9_9EURO|nr:uncharacterized protein N7479_004441 [Penicillium vulpinum]KAJ5964565.1 hypothetical protein N7479_004441 [Penicillium vulpinum]OQE11761.1 hypothetical protein PENVUL_c002G08285 [Penicillium vulpinum]
MWEWLKSKAQGMSLFDAVIIGDARKVEQLLANKCDTSIADQSGMTILHWAALRGHNKIIPLLLQNDTSLASRTDHHGRVAMHCAAENGHLEAVKLIGTTGLNISDSMGRTALHWAAGNGHLDVVIFLLNKGANASALDSFGETPLSKAASMGHESIVQQLLLPQTVKINKPDQNGYTALHRAAESKNGNVALLFLKNKLVDLDAKTATGETFFDVLGQEIPEPEYGVLEALGFITAKEVGPATKVTANDKARDAAVLHHRLNRRSAVELLLKRMNHKKKEDGFEKVLVSISKERIPAFLPTFDGQALEFLLWAVTHNMIEVVNRLIAQGIPVNRKERYPKPVLQHAAKNGFVDMVQLLLDRGAEVNASIATSSKETAFMLAAENGHLEVMRLLIDGGADIEAELAYENTPAFQRASEYGHANIVQFLLKQSAHRNIAIPTQKKLFSLRCAISSGHYDVVKLLLDERLPPDADVYGNVKSGLEIAAFKGDVKMFELVKENGFELGDNCFDALRPAICRGHHDLVGYLLAGLTRIHVSGSDVNHGLEISALRGDLKMFELLKAHGFELSSNRKKLALRNAIGSSHYDVVRHLLSGVIPEADIVSGVDDGLEAAAQRGDLKMFELLEEYGLGLSSNGKKYPLKKAIGEGHCNVVKYLLDGGIGEVDTVSMVKVELEGAAFNGSLKMFELLEEYGFEVRSSKYLIGAAERNFLPLVKFLMDHNKVDINERGSEYWMAPLHFAAKHGNVEMVNFLLDEGADINALAGKNLSRCAVDEARAGGHLKVLKVLFERGAKKYNPERDRWVTLWDPEST